MPLDVSPTNEQRQFVTADRSECRRDVPSRKTVIKATRRRSTFVIQMLREDERATGIPSNGER